MKNMRWVVVLTVALIGLVLGGTGLLAVWLPPYWTARNYGVGADLHTAVLIYARLPRANLYGANLQGANLRGAHLYQANLTSSRLMRADLSGADLRRANLWLANLSGADLRRANASTACFNYARLAGSRYNAQTRWPKGFNPQRYGAVKVQ
jgi:hypothetical protein